MLSTATASRPCDTPKEHWLKRYSSLYRRLALQALDAWKSRTSPGALPQRIDAFFSLKEHALYSVLGYQDQLEGQTVFCNCRPYSNQLWYVTTQEHLP